MRLLVNGNPNYFQILFISCNLIITVVDVLLKFWKNMYSLFHTLSKCPFMFKKVWRNYFFILALTKMRLILESENMNRGIETSLFHQAELMPVFPRIWKQVMVLCTGQMRQIVTLNDPDLSPQIFPLVLLYIWSIVFFFYCLVSMLLIWSIVSLYDLLPEAGVVMRWYSRESGTYPIHSEMSRVFYLPRHRTLTTRYPLALCCMQPTCCWVSADERRYWNFLASPSGVWTPPPPSVQQASILPLDHSVSSRGFTKSKMILYKYGLVMRTIIQNICPRVYG